MTRKKVSIIGAGNMGGAIIKGLIDSGAYKADDLAAADPREETRTQLEKLYPGITVEASNKEILFTDILIAAVKPQFCGKVLTEISPYLRHDTVLVSIAAGITLGQIADWLDKPVKLIRAMPNTPLLAGEGMTGLCPGADVLDKDIENVKKIFNAVGETMIMAEHQMDAFTALAGSSPAWVFMFIEALADGAVKEGIPRAPAYDAAAQAVLGAAKLMRESGMHPAELKDRVCSPGGTTIAGTAALEKAGFRAAVIQAVEDCTRRSRELGTQ
ncbi:MAG: pyrroline-5-carboxylate reductase [Spirochaeta sp. LUC14_002_19_P3]|nr:MAG: pyrroline-5-carboxylate reductase [Spirochaeta sp. LUC14_002_19_P3]